MCWALGTSFIRGLYRLSKEFNTSPAGAGIAKERKIAKAKESLPEMLRFI
jgi:hypothetical protein